uniref:Laminin EGF-like domain-containing protein n=1 Tax=Hippocampus comes TaxID=109280 RepID=A0A3Q3D6S8_HIPCM
KQHLWLFFCVDASPPPADETSFRDLLSDLLPGCNCSGRSDRCAFDLEQYRSTGSGGRCLDCRDNTDGAHCERCRENHYRGSPDQPCLCACHPVGSSSAACHPITGRCSCRAGVEGRLCDACRTGFFGFSSRGCRGTLFRLSFQAQEEEELKHPDKPFGKKRKKS